MSHFSDPFEEARDVTPDNDADLPFGKPKALFITAYGTLSGVTASGQTVTWTQAQLEANGPIFPWRPVRIRSTGTTATVRALY